jgi:hypothetical protein
MNYVFFLLKITEIKKLLIFCRAEFAVKHILVN